MKTDYFEAIEYTLEKTGNIIFFRHKTAANMTDNMLQTNGVTSRSAGGVARAHALYPVFR